MLDRGSDPKKTVQPPPTVESIGGGRTATKSPVPFA